jgi:hypothetical protein
MVIEKKLSQGFWEWKKHNADGEQDKEQYPLDYGQTGSLFCYVKDAAWVTVHQQTIFVQPDLVT